MISKRLAEAINTQINAELWSAYLYLSMSAHFAADGKPGFANWFYVQFKEEQDHGMKLLHYLIKQDATPKLLPIDKVDTKWKSPLAAFEDTLKHEIEVTSMINNLYSIAVEENDYASQSMLKWFVDEQVEEEETARGIIDGLKMIDGNGLAIYMMDKELGARK